MFSKLMNFIRTVLKKLLPYKDIESVERIETPLSPDMVNALDLWLEMYTGKSPWLSQSGMKSLNLPSFISSEIARQIILEMKWDITAKGAKTDAEGNLLSNPRADFLKQEFERCLSTLRKKLEQGCAAGGMTIKPYPKGDHLYCDWVMDWSLYPIAFDDDGNLADVIFRDTYTEGKTIFTRLERHTVEGDNVKITQRAFKSQDRNSIGNEVSLSEVAMWSELEPEAVVEKSEGQLFGWYKVAAANSVDVDSPMGASVYSKACDLIKDADEQYSRLMWEFKGSELAIDVDPTALKQAANDSTRKEMPQLDERLFRGVDTGQDNNYNVFSPAIRDASLINGLNQILQRIEDVVGLSRGTLADVASEARTATELRILRQRSYSTIADNQKALERCLTDVIRVMDKYATLYNLAPQGDYEVSFEWDDSIITDTEQQMNERMILCNAGIYGKSELRQWYFGETKAQADAAIEAVTKEKTDEMLGMQAALPQVTP